MANEDLFLPMDEDEPPVMPTARPGEDDGSPPPDHGVSAPDIVITREQQDPSPDEDPLISGNDLGADPDMEGLEKYSVASRKRVLRERAMARDEVAAADRIARESFESVSRLAKDNHALKKGLYELGIARVTDLLKSLQSEVATASENGDHAKLAELQMQIADAHASKKSFEEFGRTIGDAPEPVVLRSAEQMREERRKAWLEANPWFENPQFESETNYVKSIAAGLDQTKNSAMPSFWRSLNREIRARIPRISNMVRDPRRQAGDRAETEPTSRDPARSSPRPSAIPGSVAGARNNLSRGREQARGRIVLNEDDIVGMAQMNLDPHNPEHQVAWARSRVEIENKQRSRGR